jgi:HAD superfamily hydrolase (TIGR01509 family)
MDGTLVDTEPYWFESERELVESYGGTWSDEQAKSVVGFDLLDSAAFIKQHAGLPLDPHTIVDRLLDGVVARLEQHIPWRPGACRLLRELNEAGVPCALVTMSWRRFVEPVIAALPPDSFVAVITGDEVPPGQGKPSPTPYLLGAEACAADPADCVAIEDSPTGVRSALAAGCRVLGVPNVKSLDRAPGLRRVETLRGITLDDLARLPFAGAGGERSEPARAVDRRALVIGALATVAAVVLAIGLVRGRDEAAALPPGAIPIDVWAPYWTLTDTLPEAEARLAAIREASPFWYGARSATRIVLDDNIDVTRADALIERIRDSDARLVPSIRDEMPAGGMAAVLANPSTRAQHVDAVTAFAEQLDADGIDLDYEQFAFADGSSSWEATRPNWVAFVTDLAAALHDDGRTLTVSIPPVYDPAVSGERGYWVYDHGAIAEHVDAIRIMAYDYSTSSPGPIAPLAWVQEAIAGVSAAVPEQHHVKLVLGVPSYGANWVTGTVGTCPTSAEQRTSVTARSVADLITRRQATPIYDAVTGEWSFRYDLPVTDAATSCVQSRVVQWVDAEGAAARAELARRAGWGGVSLWALGYDDAEVWAALVAATRDPLD